MISKKPWAACLSSLASLTLNFQLARAHETVTVGNYAIDFGWLSEPPIVVNTFDTSRNKVPAEPKE